MQWWRTASNSQPQPFLLTRWRALDQQWGWLPNDNCPIHVVTFTLISNLATDYIKVKVTTWIGQQSTNNVNILTSDVLKLHNQNNIKWGRSEVSATASITCPPTGFGPMARPTAAAAADRKANQKGRHTSDIRRLATKTQLISTTVVGGQTFNGLMWLQGELWFYFRNCSTDEIYCLSICK